MPNKAHGQSLVRQFQRSRCHAGTATEMAQPGQDCVGCHRRIVSGEFPTTPALLAAWQPRVKDLTEAPSLEGSRRLKQSWVAGFLLAPTDLRPALHPTMPRLDLTPKDARDIAAYLALDDDLAEPKPAPADLGKGRALLEAKGCGSCHAFTGVAPLAAATPPPMDARDFARGRVLAPDLRFARERMNAVKTAAWLADPKAMKQDTPMPKVALTPAEITDLVGYLRESELAPVVPKPRVERLPLLARKVTYKEVDEKVIHRSCWHCHSEPDYAIGDGGPDNSGGFGFKPRGLNLSDYTGIAAGYIDANGERASVFAKDDKGVPRLVAAMLARHDEESGVEGSIRGMPLAYDPVALADIKLVDTWITQGRPK